MFTRPDPVVDNKINEFNAGHPPYKSHFYWNCCVVRGLYVWAPVRTYGKWSFFNWMQWQLACSCSCCQFDCEWSCICPPSLCIQILSLLFFGPPISPSPVSECIFKWLLKALRKRLSLQWPRNWLSHAAAIKMSLGSVRQCLAFDPFLFCGWMGVALQRVSG